MEGGGVVMLIKGSAEEFQCDSVKAYFVVVTDDGQYVMGRLADIFESENVSKRENIKGFLFEIRVDIIWKDVSYFETYIEVLSNRYGEEYLNAIHERDGASIRGGPFRMRAMMISLDWLGIMRWMRKHPMIRFPSAVHCSGRRPDTFRVKLL